MRSLVSAGHIDGPLLGACRHQHLFPHPNRGGSTAVQTISIDSAFPTGQWILCSAEV